MRSIISLYVYNKKTKQKQFNTYMTSVYLILYSSWFNFYPRCLFLLPFSLPFYFILASPHVFYFHFRRQDNILKGKVQGIVTTLRIQEILRILSVLLGVGLGSPMEKRKGERKRRRRTVRGNTGGI